MSVDSVASALNAHDCISSRATLIIERLTNCCEKSTQHRPRSCRQTISGSWSLSHCQRLSSGRPASGTIRALTKRQERKFASFKSRMGGLAGQVRASARRSEHLTRVEKVSWGMAGCGRMRQPVLQDNANTDEPDPTL